MVPDPRTWPYDKLCLTEFTGREWAQGRYVDRVFVRAAVRGRLMWVQILTDEWWYWFGGTMPVDLDGCLAFNAWDGHRWYERYTNRDGLVKYRISPRSHFSAT